MQYFEGGNMNKKQIDLIEYINNYDGDITREDMYGAIKYLSDMGDSFHPYMRYGRYKNEILDE